MDKLLKQAQEHSIVNKFAWVLTNGFEMFYTDNEELFNSYADNGFNCIKEYYKGFEIKQ